jgi:hypothetical protein
MGAEGLRLVLPVQQPTSPSFQKYAGRLFTMVGKPTRPHVGDHGESIQFAAHVRRSQR